MHECEGGTGIVSSAADVLGMLVARGMRGDGGVWKICMCWLGAVQEAKM